MLTKNKLIPLEITAISHEGDGIGRFEGMAVFVPMTAIGDRIRAKVVKVLKNHAYAIIDELVQPSAHRVPEDCPVFARCGGCSLRHIGYPHELAVKSGGVGDNLARIGSIDCALDVPLPSPCIDRYRNKAQYPVRRINGKIRTGFFAKRSHALIPVEDCLLQPAFFRDITQTIVAFAEQFSIEPYDEEAHSGVLRHIYIRFAEKTGQVMVCLVINASTLPHGQELVRRLRAACPDVATVVLGINKERTNVVFGSKVTVLFGPGHITDELCGISVDISPLSFYQVNRPAAEALYRTALEYADPRPGDTLLDLYCGAGAIGLSMAHAVKEVIGVEVVAEAVEDARKNARQNGITNARFLCADAFEAVAQLQKEGMKPDIVVLDPPRKGAGADVIACIGQLSPQKVVYISCNSSTLARDCKALYALGYRMEKARAADLFPRTAHMECVALLSKAEE